MAFETERKFLVKGEYKSLAFDKKHIKQGYLSSDPNRTVRVRLCDDNGYLTIKGPSNFKGLTRFEWEKQITREEAESLLQYCEPGMIDKTRYLIQSGKHLIEVDEFYGDNQGLVLAEVELGSEDEEFDKPCFFDQEVTGDIRYYNSQLMKHPFTRW